jgi:hypothetical protein
MLGSVPRLCFAITSGSPQLGYNGGKMQFLVYSISFKTAYYFLAKQMD